MALDWLLEALPLGFISLLDSLDGFLVLLALDWLLEALLDSLDGLLVLLALDWLLEALPLGLESLLDPLDGLLVLLALGLEVLLLFTLDRCLVLSLDLEALLGALHWLQILLALDLKLLLDPLDGLPEALDGLLEGLLVLLTLDTLVEAVKGAGFGGDQSQGDDCEAESDFGNHFGSCSGLLHLKTN